MNKAYEPKLRSFKGMNMKRAKEIEMSFSEDWVSKGVQSDLLDDSDFLIINKADVDNKDLKLA